MNSLSWLLYLADFAGKTGKFSAIFGTLSLIAFAIGLVGYLVNRAESSFRIDNRDELASWKIFTKIAASIAAPLLLIAAVTPSQNTVYAIAASEMGEKALQTPTANKAFDALDAWLDKQIEETKETKEEDK